MGREFRPPGPGSWALQTTHLNGAITAFAAQGWLTGLTRATETVTRMVRESGPMGMLGRSSF